MFRVQQDDLEDFMTEVTETRIIMVKEIGTGTDPRAGGKRCRQRALSQLKGCLELRRLREPNTWHLT
jgi:hypothetical protein